MTSHTMRDGDSGVHEHWRERKTNQFGLRDVAMVFHLLVTLGGLIWAAAQLSAGQERISEAQAEQAKLAVVQSDRLVQMSLVLAHLDERQSRDRDDINDLKRKVK